MCPQIFKREILVYPPQVEWLRKQAEAAGIKVSPYFYDIIALANIWIKKKFEVPLPVSSAILNLSTGEFTQMNGQIRYYPFSEERRIFFRDRKSYPGMKLEKEFCDYIRKNINTTITILDWSVMLYESYGLLQRAIDRVTELEIRLEKLVHSHSQKTVPNEWEAFS